MKELTFSLEEKQVDLNRALRKSSPEDQPILDLMTNLQLEKELARTNLAYEKFSRDLKIESETKRALQDKVRSLEKRAADLDQLAQDQLIELKTCSQEKSQVSNLFLSYYSFNYNYCHARTWIHLSTV